MMKLRIQTIAVVMSLGLVACDMNEKEFGYSKFLQQEVSTHQGGSTSVGGKPQQEPSKNSSQKKMARRSKEAPKKSSAFYQHLLERFCQIYYGDCFSRRDYHRGSVIVNNVNFIPNNWDEDGRVVSWKAIVKGVHSFKGLVKNHNDSPFDAYVDGNHAG